MRIDNIAIESEFEREALDMIDATSKQVESLANNSESPNSSEWKNGEECIYMSHNVAHQFIGPCPKREGYGYIQAPGYEVNFVELSKLSKPESPNGTKYNRAVGGPVKLSPPEWSGEGLPPVGIKCCFTPDNNLWGFASTDTYLGEVLRYEGEQFVFLLSHNEYNIRPCHLIVSRTDKGEFSKPETPEQRKERERLEAAYDLCTTVYPDFSGFDEFKKATTTVNLWLVIVDKTGYRKEQK